MGEKILILILMIALYIGLVQFIKRRTKEKDESSRSLKMNVRGIEIEYDNTKMGREELKDVMMLIGEVYDLEEIDEEEIEFPKESKSSKHKENVYQAPNI